MSNAEFDLSDPENVSKLVANRQVPESLLSRSEGALIDLPADMDGRIGSLLENGLETGNQLKKLSEAKKIWKETLADPKNVIYFGLSGDMVSVGMAPTIAALAEKGMIDVLFSQGANMYHDFGRSIGYTRAKTFPQQIDDTTIFDEGGVRMYDVLEPAEPQFVSKVFVPHVAKSFADEGVNVVTTRQFYNRVAEMMYKMNLVEKEGILTTCYRNNVPIFIAGPESSVTAMDLAAAQHIEGIDLEIGVGKELRDHSTMQDKIENMGFRSNLVEIGGGVMRNTIQQVATGSYIVRGEPWSMEGGAWFKRHQNVILLTTDTGVPFGGSSSVPMVEHNAHAKHKDQGENISWGKFDETGLRVTVYLDATIGLPMLFQALMHDSNMDKILAARKRHFKNLASFPIEIE